MSIHHSDILFFDLEINPRTQKLMSAGTFNNGTGRHITGPAGIEQIRQVVSTAKCLCGHNIIHHDIPFLYNVAGLEAVRNIATIDTLLLSPLLRPQLKIHKLDKDYFPETLDKSDPVLDAQLSAELLDGLVDAWQALPYDFKLILKSLLLYQPGFNQFWVRFAANIPLIYDLPVAIQAFFKNKLCHNAHFVRHPSRLPIELAYVLAIIDSGQTSIHTPSWIISAYPRIWEVFKSLRSTPCNHPDCRWCTVKLDPHKGLLNFFGYKSFRSFEGDKEGAQPLQEQAVRGALEGESLMVLFPTGGGKSLTFQLPALMRGRLTGALTVIISPLVALMKDQVDVLKAKSIPNAVAINGLLSPLERAEAFEKIEDSTVNLLYISPEALRSNSILNLLKHRFIDRFVIDEAHCFSAWGQDFRVDYFYIGTFIKMLGEVKELQEPIPVSCFTATARPEVIKDIQEYFEDKLKITLKLYKTQEERKNLRFEAVPAETGEARLQQLMEILGPQPAPTIVYVNRTGTAEKVSDYLKKRSLPVAFYHGKMEVEDKKRVLEDFKSGDLSVIVATSAFGMGVDKDNVGMVIHYEVSQSLENYAQEAGRGGRDPKLNARCIIMFRNEDLDKHFALLKQTMLHQPDIAQIWKAIKSFKHQDLTKSCLEIAKVAGWDTDADDLDTKVKTAINALEIADYVERSQNSPLVFPSSLGYSSLEKAKAIRNNFAYKFTREQLEHSDQILQYIYGKEEVRIDYMAERLGIHDSEIKELLCIFNEIGILQAGLDVKLRIPSKSQSEFKTYTQLEPLLIQYLSGYDQGQSTTINLRDINEALSQEAYSTEIFHLLNHLRMWEWEGWIRKSRKKADNYIYDILFKKSSIEIAERIAARLALAKAIMGLIQKQSLAEFPLKDLKQKLEAEDMFAPKAELPAYQKALIYLNDIRAIELLEGILIHKNRLKIFRKETNNYKQYTQADYLTLKKHYEQRVQQVHIVGEYAKSLLADNAQARKLLSSYFQMDFKGFLQTHFPHRLKDFLKAITPERHELIFGSLSKEQLDPVEDTKSTAILIAAGPGSGKTRVLVSKMASALMLEEVRAEGFLMLAFSRPAVLEFRERLKQVLPEMAKRVTILTFHAFAFQVLGKTGTLERSENIIELATKAIMDEHVDPSQVAGRTAIFVDEFQDISHREWNFLQAILGRAEGCKLIAVGDDDQAIYGFRDGTSDYMWKLSKQEGAKTYFLTTNYRSDQRILQFANAFLEFLPAHLRIKNTQPLKANNPEQGLVQIIHYQSGHIIPALVERVKTQPQKGSTAILCSTNEEVLLVSALLRLAGIPAQTLNFRNEFRLSAIAELAHFTRHIMGIPTDTHGLISSEVWTAGLNELKLLYKDSTDLPIALQVINDFSKEHTLYYQSEWKAYLVTLNPEDYVQLEKDKVYVSTIHKAKGKEFDHLHLLLQDQDPDTDEKLRVIYVGITRAIHSLFIHTCLPIFKTQPYLPAQHLYQQGHLLPAKEIELECGMKDVILDRFISLDLSKKLLSLRAGQPLVCYPQSSVISLSGTTFPFSSKFKQRLDDFITLGYTIQSAQIAHIVWWKKPNQEIAPVPVVLPRLRMQRP